MTVSLDQLIERVRLATDHVSSSFVTDDELTKYLNTQGAELHDLLVNRFEGYFLTSSNFTISNNQSYTPADEVVKIVGLDLQRGTQYVPLERFNFNERFRANQNRTSPWVYDNVQATLTFHWAGGNILVYPEASCGGTYKLWFIPAWTDLASGSNPTLRPPYTHNHWQEVMVHGASAMVRIKEEADPNDFLAQKVAYTTRIKESSAERDATGLRRLSEFSNNYDFWGWDP